jgi:mannose-6-phosphate isomerase
MFKFRPILKSTLWGGEKIVPFKHLQSTQTNVGESWEISDVEGDESIVASGPDAGKNLSELVKEYQGDLVGDANYAHFGNRFPLLIKFTPTMPWPCNATTRWARPRCGTSSTMPAERPTSAPD